MIIFKAYGAISPELSSALIFFNKLSKQVGNKFNYGSCFDLKTSNVGNIFERTIN